MFVPLQQWIDGERASKLGPNRQLHEGLILKLVPMAYGLSHLIKQILQRNLASSLETFKILCSIDNFMVRFSDSSLSTPTPDQNLNSFIGIDMMVPRMSLQFVENLDFSSLFDESSNNTLGRYLEFEINAVDQPATTVSQLDEGTCCNILGHLIYDLFFKTCPLPTSELQEMRLTDESTVDVTGGQARKKTASLHNLSMPAAGNMQSYTSLLDLGFSPSISMILENLMECGRGGNSPNPAYASIEAVCHDFRILIREPDLYLFDHHHQQNHVSETNGIFPLRFSGEKLYGREKECGQLNEAFYRVTSGTSEVFFVGGYSGCGKTRLVESLIEQVNLFDGFLATAKLDLMEQPYSTIISLFNSLCLTIKDRTTPEELQMLVSKLMTEFSSDFFLLGKLLPNVYLLCHQPEISLLESQSSPQMNLQSVSFILQRFMKTVSSKHHPVMLFLDDMQWADQTSLELVHNILSDVKNSSVFFVGSFRENEVDSDHVIFEMARNLEISRIPTSTLILDGLNRPSLNGMISDALGMLPRFCQPLSDLVFQKTHGNPLFVQEFLKSLIDRSILQYSFRNKKWTWDAIKIASEDTMGNVLSVLSSKMSVLTEDHQSALKAMACFGIKVNEAVAQRLSSMPQFSNLLKNLEQAMEDGFIAKNSGEFMFVHDSIQEAAYNLIPANERDKLHFDLALSLYYACKGDDLDSMLFIICDQFNKVHRNLKTGLAMELDAVDLFNKAGSKALKQSEYPRARNYFGVAESLLPTNCWDSGYNQCLELFFLSAKSCCACGDFTEAKSFIKQILDNGRCLGDKLDACYLLTLIYFEHHEGDLAIATCCAVLSQLNEPIPEVSEPNDVSKMVKDTSSLLNNVSDKELLRMKEAQKDGHSAIKFYSIAAILGNVFRTQLFPVCTCKLVQLAIKNGVSGFAALGFSLYGSMLCFNTSLQDIPMARRMGKLSMSFKKRFDMKEHIPVLYTAYYGFSGPFVEPLQACADMHRVGFEHGLSLGDSRAFVNTYFCLRSSFLAGENLSKLLKETEHFSKLAIKFGHGHAKALLDQYRETLLLLIGKEEMSNMNSNSNVAVISAKHNFHLAVQSFWLRRQDQFEKSCRDITGMDGLAVQNAINKYTVLFYHGLNLLQFQEEISSPDIIHTVNLYIEDMKQLAENQRWNFINKVQLLGAVVLVARGNHNEAKKSYAAAIASAHRSKFVHEEGLACELAGFHCVNIDEKDEAVVHFKRARECYVAWGSQVKVEFVERVMEKVTGKT